MREDGLEQIIENLLRQSSFRSIQLKVDIDQENISINPGTFTAHTTYLQTDQGARFFDYKSDPGPTGHVSHRTHFCDGKKSASIDYKRGEPERQQQILISHSFGIERNFGFFDAPDPLRWFYVGLTPLAESLPKGERLADGIVIGRSCDVFHFKKVGSRGPQSLVYYLDKKTSVPLRVSAYADPDRIRKDKPNWTWEATSLDLVSGRSFPLSSTYKAFDVSMGPAGILESNPSITQKIQVKEVTFDAAIPASSFWPVVQEDVEILDRDQLLGPRQSISKVAKTENPVRVSESTGDGLWVTWAIVAVSLIALGFAVKLWRTASAGRA